MQSETIFVRDVVISVISIPAQTASTNIDHLGAEHVCSVLTCLLILNIVMPEPKDKQLYEQKKWYMLNNTKNTQQIVLGCL